jgi:hypothetical protein
VFERALAVVCLAGALLVSLALTGAFQPAHLPGAFGAQYCPADQYGTPTGDCLDDTTPPLISSTVTPGPNVNGWNNTNVTLVFNATDESGGSGVRSINCSLGGTTDGATRGIVFTAATVNTTVTCTAMDWAGNVSDPASRSIRIDKVRPSIGVGIRAPLPDLYGWNNTDVTVTWPCADAFSGPVSPTVSTTVTTNGSFQSATGICADLAGNQTSGQVGGISIDKTAIAPTGGPPNDNIANATVVPSLPFSVSADTTTATRETHEPICSSPADDHTVWYVLTAAHSGLVRVGLDGSFPTTPVISVWRPTTTTGLQFVSCRVAATAGSSTFTAQAGLTYYVRIGGISGPGPAGAGPFTVGIDFVPPPPNDAFADAKVVSSLPFSDALDLTAATVETGEPLHPNGSLSALTRTAWYRFTPLQDEMVVLGGTTVLSSVSTMAVYTGSTLATLHQVVASTQVIPQGATNFLFPLVFRAFAGTTYSIQAGTFVFPTGNDVATIGLEQPIVYLGQTPAANANGWNNTSVTLSWHCSALFPFVTPTAMQTLFAEGSNQSATGFCSSPFGSASDTEGGIDIDKTPPLAPTAAADRPPDYAGGGGWYQDVVTVSFTDNGEGGASGSGVDPASTPAAVTFDTAGSHTATGTVRDLAGNVSAPGSLTVQVDTAAPGLSASFTKADGSPYTRGTWTNQAVTATFSCDDSGGSGVATTTAPQTVSTEGVDQSVTGSCTDNVGHVTTQTFAGIDIDLTPPEASFRFDPTSLDLVLTATDRGGSGIDPGPVAPVVAPAKGGGQVRTYTLTDRAGNTLVLVLQAKADTGGLQATVTSLRYNGGQTVAAPFTALVYTWTLARDGSLRTLDQSLTIGKGAAQQFVDASFDASKNQTKITGTGSTSTVAGLDLLRVTTSAGALAIQT